MNYQKHYDALIARGKRTLIHGYRELHHIIPKCLGGSNNEDNLVWLTASEHYVAHQLLVKMNPTHRGLAFAALMMCSNNGRTQRSNKVYGWLRERAANNAISFKHTKETKAKISKTTKGKPKDFQFSDEHISKLSKAKLGNTNASGKRTPEQVLRNSLAQTGKKQTPETIAKRKATMEAKKAAGWKKTQPKRR